MGLWLLAITTVYGENSQFDRLFSSAHTRAGLNEARMKFRIDESIPAEDETAIQQRNIKLNGVLIRSDGSSQIWINDKAQADGAGPVEAARLKKANTAQVSVTMRDGTQVLLKPGEIYSLETGAIREAYEQRQPVIPPDLAVRAEESEQDAENEAASFEFEESKLAEQDSRIHLLESRLEQLESTLKQSQQSQRIILNE